MTSKSAKTLSQALNCKRVRQNGRYRAKASHLIINWGNSQQASWERPGINLLNPPTRVAIACNKLLSFRKLTENNTPIPEFTTSSSLAKAWAEDGHKVYCRINLTGHSGQGIILANTPEEVVVAPLYTKYTKCKHEYRVHVMKGQIIDYIQKKKKEGAESNQYIRSHVHGWIFARQGVELPICVKLTAIKAVQALGLDFGAVDIGYKESNTSPISSCFVYEVNTAPGLEGTTLQRYKQAFESLAICYN